MRNTENVPAKLCRELLHFIACSAQDVASPNHDRLQNTSSETKMLLELWGVLHIHLGSYGKKAFAIGTDECQKEYAAAEHWLKVCQALYTITEVQNDS